MSTISGNTPINLEPVDIHENKSEQKQFKGNLRIDTLLRIEKFGEVLNMSRSQILEESVNAYMNASFNWQTRRYFLEKKEKTNGPRRHDGGAGSDPRFRKAYSEC